MQDFSYEHDSVALTGQIARPSGKGPHPAVLVMHSALGITELECRRARDLAALGYVALAADMYGVGRQLSKEQAGRPFLKLQKHAGLCARESSRRLTRCAPSTTSTAHVSARSASASAVNVCWNWRAAVPMCDP
jgi:dienelactone hydrolase